MESHLEVANAQLADQSRQFEIFVEQFRLMNQCQFGKHFESASEINGQFSLFDSFNELEGTQKPSAKEPEITEVVISSYGHSKRKGKRETDLDGLPARVFDRRLTDEELAEKFPQWL